MKYIKGNNTADNFWYLLMCIFSLGTVYFLRVLISEGVRQAYEEVKEDQGTRDIIKN